MGFRAILVVERWGEPPKREGKPMVVCKATVSMDHSAGFARPNQKAKGRRALTVVRKAIVS